MPAPPYVSALVGRSAVHLQVVVPFVQAACFHFLGQFQPLVKPHVLQRCRWLVVFGRGLAPMVVLPQRGVSAVLTTTPSFPHHKVVGFRDCHGSRFTTKALHQVLIRPALRGLDHIRHVDENKRHLVQTQLVGFGSLIWVRKIKARYCAFCNARHVGRGLPGAPLYQRKVQGRRELPRYTHRPAAKPPGSRQADASPGTEGIP